MDFLPKMNIATQDFIKMSNINKLLKIEDTFFRDLPCNIYINDKKGRMLDCNINQAHIVGVKKCEDVIGTTIFDWTVEKDAVIIKNNNNKVITTRSKIIVYESVQLIKKSVNIKTISFKFPLVNKLEKSIALIGMSFVLSSENRINPFDKLTHRQKNCLFHLIKGLSYKQIAQRLKLSPKTVENYLNIIKDKLHCINRSELIEKCWQHNFILEYQHNFLFS